MRWMLATEGASDEAVLERLISSVWPRSEITRKRFPARGIAQVVRLLPDTVRAAHFGGFDRLVVHVDADDHPHSDTSHDPSACRYCTIRARMAEASGPLPPRLGLAELVRIAAVPHQSTDAWLWWGRDGGSSSGVEQLDRHLVKQQLYGGKHPRLDLTVPAIDALVERVARGEVTPPSLARFLVDASG